MLLIVYPFQVALALADGCCTATAAGVTHHGVQTQGSAAIADAPVLVAGDALSAASDPHCPACSLGHQSCLASSPVFLAALAQGMSPGAFRSPFVNGPPLARLERPKWPSAAR